MTQKRYYSLRELYRKYLIYLKKNGPKMYVEFLRIRSSIRQYFEWLKEQTLTIYKVDKNVFKEFCDFLFSYRQPDGALYSVASLYRKLRSIYHFHQWVEAEKMLPQNPFSRQIYLSLRKRARARDAPDRLKEKPASCVPDPFISLYEEASKWDALRGYHPSTLSSHKRGWEIFFDWLNSQGVNPVESVGEKELIAYQVYLTQAHQARSGHCLTAVVLMRYLIAVKVLFDYLLESLRIHHNPAHVIKLPKCSSGIPRTLMSRHEVETLLTLPNLTTLDGVRDRAMMELFYSSGLRLNELCQLKVEDILFTEGMLRVSVPKGGVRFQRVIPIGEVALEWIKKYLTQVRSKLTLGKSHSYLFVNKQGRVIRKGAVGLLIKGYCFKAGFRKPITTHSFRVTCATEMLRGKADIRYVQAQLGHTSLQSTQIYARVLPTDLKKVHQRTHPRERRRESRLSTTKL